jgi:site-specific recombinase XerC
MGNAMTGERSVLRIEMFRTSTSRQELPMSETATSALRFFLGTTLDRPELARHFTRVHYPRPLPRVLSTKAVGRLLEVAHGPGLKFKAALSIAYGAGLRAGEIRVGGTVGPSALEVLKFITSARGDRRRQNRPCCLLGRRRGALRDRAGRRLRSSLPCSAGRRAR